MPVPALRAMDVDLDPALEHVNVPTYVIDRAGVMRWMNEAARRLVGDQVGRQFTSVVAPEDSRRARDIFTRQIVGNSEVTTSPSRSSTRRAHTSLSRSARYRFVAVSMSSACSDRS